MRKKQLLPILPIFFFIGFFMSSQMCWGVVKYDEGQILVEGIQLLQDKDNPNDYYYIPQYPRVSKKEDGALEIMCMKYVGTSGTASNGGVFHALIEFTLPVKLLESLESSLKKVAGASARIAGPVPIQQAVKDGEAGLASFQVVSSVLKDNTFTKSIITSGFAPFLPGSKAAISARLSQEGATLLFATLERPTSDVSIALSGYYEAAVKAYQAEVTAESKVIYEHFSKVFNQAEGYTKDEVRKVSDKLVRDQVIKIQSFDRGAALNVNTKDMEAILSMITDKLIELMFNAEKGWAKEPERAAVVGQNQIPMRQEKGFLGQLFGGTGNQEYISDNQFVLKKIKDERLNRFYLNLSKSTTIKVPIYTSGNIAFLMSNLEKEERNKYFFTVNMDDEDFQMRDVNIQIDGSFAEAFGDVFNNVSVNFRKSYNNDQSDVTKDIVFDRKTVETGTVLQHILYPRLGLQKNDWLNYEYKIAWSMKGNSVPIADGKWQKSDGNVITLVPPFQKRIIEVDADRGFFKEDSIISATIRFLSIVRGDAVVQKTLILRANDTELTSKVALFHDIGESVGYQVTWYKKEGDMPEPTKILNQDYIILVPPK
jgi:hypothetical protein